MGKRTQPSLPVTSVRRDCPLTGEEGEDDARSACPLMPRAALVIQWDIQRDAIQQCGANPDKVSPSSDCGLQLAHMKSESLVIAGQLYRGEYVLKSCTHRPSSQGSRGCPKSAFMWPKVNLVTGTKS